MRVETRLWHGAHNITPCWTSCCSVKYSISQFTIHLASKFLLWAKESFTTQSLPRKQKKVIRVAILFKLQWKYIANIVFTASNFCSLLHFMWSFSISAIRWLPVHCMFPFKKLPLELLGKFTILSAFLIFLFPAFFTESAPRTIYS